jgi:thiol-disulfide isomerase/thioredoxin
MFKTILLISICIIQGLTLAQVDLSKLHKAQPTDLDFSQPLMLDGKTIPVCLENGKQISSDSLDFYLGTGNLIPEPFINDRKEVKAFVLRSASEQEKGMMMRMNAPMEKVDLTNESIPANLSLRTLKNKEVQLSDFNPKKEKITVINFWFIECKPCKMEIPDLNKLVEKYKGYDVEFLAIALNKPDQLKDFLKKTDFNYTVLSIAEQQTIELGIQGYPTHFILNRQGQVVYKATGLEPGSIDKLDKAIEGQLH